MLCLDGRRSSQRRDRLQGMGSILGKAQDDRKRNRDCFARVRSKRPRTRSLGCRARVTRRMRNRHCDQTGPVRALRLCHVDRGAPFKSGLLFVTGMQHDQNGSSADESIAPTSRLRCTFREAMDCECVVYNRSHGVTIRHLSHEALFRVKTKHPRLSTGSFRRQFGSPAYCQIIVAIRWYHVVCGPAHG